MKIILERLPETPEEWKAMPQTDLTHPENACLMFLCALHLYVKNPDWGIEAMNRLRGPRPMTPYDIQFLRNRMREKQYLPLAYFAGAVPENDYTPGKPLTLEVLPTPRPQDVEAGYMKVFLKTAGADDPRPVTLRRKGNTWCLWEYSSILTGIRPPVSEDPWA